MRALFSGVSNVSSPVFLKGVALIFDLLREEVRAGSPPLSTCPPSAHAKCSCNAIATACHQVCRRVREAPTDRPLLHMSGAASEISGAAHIFWQSPPRLLLF